VGRVFGGDTGEENSEGGAGVGGGAEARQGGEVDDAVREFARELLARPVALHPGKGSFDCVGGSLREPPTSLRMTGLRWDKD
jgi:hypothetical protein